VLGGGVAGCLAALEVRRRGKKVVVLDTEGSTGSELGHIVTGLELPYSVAVRRLGREAASEIWETHRENHARLRDLLGELRDDCGYRSTGGFRLSLSRKAALDLAESEDLLREDGFHGEFLDHYMLEARFDVRGFSGGYWAADDGEVSAQRLASTLLEAVREAGAEILEPAGPLSLDFSADGILARSGAEPIRAAHAVLAPRAEAPWLVLKERMLVRESTRLRAEAKDLSLPSPALTLEGNVHWRWCEGAVEAGLCEASLPGGPFRSPSAFGSLEAFMEASCSASPWGEAGRSKVADSKDGLPLIGPLGALPVAAACGWGCLSAGYAVLAARWAVEALITGRDPTPRLFRAARPSSPTS